MPHLPRHPPGAKPSVLRDRPEHPPHVVIIHRRPHRRREHQPVVLPQRPGRQPVLRPPPPVLPERPPPQRAPPARAPPACRTRCSRNASTHLRGSASVRRDSGVLVSPPARSARHTNTATRSGSNPASVT